MWDMAKYKIFAALLMLLAGCATVDTSWEEATSTETVQAYEAFLKRYPDSDYTVMAKEKIESLQWQDATDQQTYSAFQKYLLAWPNGKHSSEAKNRIESLEWENAKRLNSLSWYESFLQKYPRSKFLAQARAELQTFAKVVVDFPDKLKSQISYYNINGPVWVFKIVFRETNGVAAIITQKMMRIQGKDGRQWGDFDSKDIYNSEPFHRGVVERL